MRRLENKVVVLSGGTGVLGQAMARALCDEGAKLAIFSRNKEAGEAFIQDLQQEGRRAVFFQADVLNKQSLLSLRNQIHENLGSCDILINAAGGNKPQGTTVDERYNYDQTDAAQKTAHRSPQAQNPENCAPELIAPQQQIREAEASTFMQSPGPAKDFFALSLEGFESVFELNFTGTFLCCQVFAQDMLNKSGCSILNISSMGAFNPLSKVPAYCAAKAAINNFTQWLAVYFAPAGLRVNALVPGFFSSTQNQALLWNADGSLSERGKKIIDHTPLGRFGSPEDLAGPLIWLSDPQTSGFVSGALIPVDGGFQAFSGV